MFKNKIVIVTGGANGIGKCITEEFQKNGATVCVIDKAPGEHYVGDIAEKTVLESFVKEVIENYGRVDVLVNNALPLMCGIDECSYEKFEYALAVGVTAPFYLTKLCKPYFAEGASVINISSSRDRMLRNSRRAEWGIRWILQTWYCSLLLIKQALLQERISVSTAV